MCVYIRLMHDAVQQDLTRIASNYIPVKTEKKEKAAESNDTENEYYLYQTGKLRHRKVK